MIWAITTVLTDEDGMLRHWLWHYRQLADQMVVCVASGSYIRPNFNLFEHLIVAAISESLAIGPTQHIVQADILAKLGVKDDDWVITADLDEFYEFPCRIGIEIDRLEASGADGVIGHFVDMVASDGTLPPAKHFAMLSMQYPVETRMTELFLRGGTRKVMLHRPWVNLSPGHHGASIHQHMDHPDPKMFYGGGDYKVRHYKWRASLVRHLRRCLASNRCGDRWNAEAKNLLAYLARNDGKINFNDPPGLTDMANRRFDNPC
jgi:hypothetical protein